MVLGWFKVVIFHGVKSEFNDWFKVVIFDEVKSEFNDWFNDVIFHGVKSEFTGWFNDVIFYSVKRESIGWFNGGGSNPAAGLGSERDFVVVLECSRIRYGATGWGECFLG